MEKRLLIATLVLGVCAAGIGRCSEAAGCDGRLALKLRPGDTLGALFGGDWNRVWHCNQVVFVRAGQEVTSPDLVAAGQVVRIPDSARLMPETERRLAELGDRRLQIERRLAALPPAAAAQPGSRKAVETCRRILGDPLRFVTDLDYLERQVAFLEAFEPPSPGASPALAPDRRFVWPAAAALLLAIGVRVWRSRTAAANADLEHRCQRVTERVTTLCRDAGIRLESRG
jgi:hypothetical protein